MKESTTVIKTYEYITRGVCSQKITFTVNGNGILLDVQFIGGCNGNLQGIASLVTGMSMQDVIVKLKGIHCGDKISSCPDQLVQALEQYC